MTAYKRIVCLCLGLVVVLVFDGICEFTMQPSQPFYQSLNKPYINTIAHMLFYFFHQPFDVSTYWREHFEQKIQRLFCILDKSFLSENFKQYLYFPFT
ncbi:MAG TPA: hypothetical protein GXZ42_03260 [Clostridiales bacterium]|nr:hypothetical protein [Clostridiales bacterium]